MEMFRTLWGYAGAGGDEEAGVREARTEEGGRTEMTPTIKFNIPPVIINRVLATLRRSRGYPHPDSGESQKLLQQSEEVCREFAAALAENPIVPTDGMIGLCDSSAIEVEGDIKQFIMEFQRRMFREPEPEPEPEVPEEIKDLLLPNIESGFFKPEVLNARLAEAFRRGQKSNR
jgi:hypothetical protein